MFEQWNGQDLAKIDQNSPDWIKFSAFASDPENQALLVTGGLLAKRSHQSCSSVYEP